MRDFGARPGDGKDDSQAFQQALDQAAREGGGVRIPAGRFRLHKPLQIKTSGVFLQGQGAGKTLVMGLRATVLGQGLREEGGRYPYFIHCAFLPFEGTQAAQMGRFFRAASRPMSYPL